MCSPYCLLLINSGALAHGMVPPIFWIFPPQLTKSRKFLTDMHTKVCFHGDAESHEADLRLLLMPTSPNSMVPVANTLSSDLSPPQLLGSDRRLFFPCSLSEGEFRLQCGSASAVDATACRRKSNKSKTVFLFLFCLCISILLFSSKQCSKVDFFKLHLKMKKLILNTIFDLHFGVSL